MTTRTSVFKLRESSETIPELPADVKALPSLPKTRSGKLAHEKISQGYAAFLSDADDKSPFWDSYADGAIIYFAGNMKNLSRYPKDAKLFWAVFYSVVTHGLEEVISNPIIDLLVWDNGYAFATSHNSYRAYSGKSWKGASLNRMKYDESGRIYDQAFFYEDLAAMDSLVGELFDLPSVQNDVFEKLGIRL
ncbi:hypothetical protein M427DRAFT_157175 [Gonapodya prolifera JEL478]|uniref:SnoaL-like domain-containing protein n=1 Tax=Gonapodya prolifera (strain JEL478) TaxID=1344416 RepID=A0A139A733_GONPJ|nr:hypothetical protein M427DRAFT_157175 [Gonapodya prolifera JEL478]|eukprot:KXS12591.1 hypothetical protein M427DRAFT_157175 [Gonapodya prolifera JEL478]